MLEVLEESLLEFPGALVLVTHDRYLLDRVSTRILALDGLGGAVPYADYDQWETGRRAVAAAGPPPRPGSPRAAPEATSVRRPGKRGYLEQREWDEMEARILAAEARLDGCRLAAADPAVAADHVCELGKCRATTESTAKARMDASVRRSTRPWNHSRRGTGFASLPIESAGLEPPRRAARMEGKRSWTPTCSC